ncbi:MAG TPA: XRE family transcriptional regulator [Lachnoclostridium sp.]|uniref:helix-turn-helix domain-containing protein n=1 Tax=Lacrimispora sp. TaxID=2719234 RepID=UPI000EE7048A|nr:helix-turn-helix transcriptional regulator [Lacrimispora sp.]HCD45960.1 XRE family transcriptional regulator [Lachnoclostridium sp.]
MYKNKAKDGRNNVCGHKIKEIREKLPEKTSQRKLADMLQMAGIDVDKNAVQRIENGKRFVTDIELKVIAEVLRVSYQELLDD